MEVHGGAEIHTAAHGGPHATAGGHTLKEVAACGEPTLEETPGRTCDQMANPHCNKSIPEGLQPMERTHAGAVNEKLQPVGRTHAGAVCEGLYPMGGTPCWSRGRE